MPTIKDPLAQLSAAETAILTALAVLQQCCNQAQLLKLMQVLAIRADDGKAFAQPKLKTVLQRLQQLELVIQQPGAGYELNDRPYSFGIQARLMWQLQQQGELVKWLVATRASEKLSDKHDYWRRYERPECRREMWLAALLNDRQSFLQWRQRYLEAPSQLWTLTAEPLFWHPDGVLFMQGLDLQIQQYLLQEILLEHSWALGDCREAYQYSKQLFEQYGDQLTVLLPTLGVQALLRADFITQAAVASYLPAQSASFRFIQAVQQGHYPQAYQQATDFIKYIAKQQGKRKVQLHYVPGALYIASALAAGSTDSLKKGLEQLLGHRSSHSPQFHSLLYPLFTHLQSGEPLRPARLHFADLRWYDMDMWMTALAAFWLGADIEHDVFAELEELREFTAAVGYDWVTAELDELLALVAECPRVLPEHWHQLHQLKPLTALYQPKAQWQMALRALSELGGKPKAEQKTSRLAWFLQDQGAWLDLDVKEQKRTVSGWTKGKAVALRRLSVEQETLDCLSPADKAVAACIRAVRNYYGGTQYEFDREAALKALIGHPHVFWLDAPDTPLELTEGKVSLQLKRQGTDYKLALEPPVLAEQSLVWRKTSPTRLTLYPVTPDIEKAGAIVGKGLKVPASAKTELMVAIECIAPVLQVQSDLPELTAQLPQVDADAQLYLHLLPLRQGLRVQVLVKPLAEGPWLTPAKGSAVLVGEQQGKTVQTQRDLVLEKRQLKSLLQSCAVLEQQVIQDGQWQLDEPELCLELLEQLAERPDFCQLIWPEGQPFKLKAKRDSKDFSLSLKQQGDWFIADGQLKLDDETVLSLKELLGLMQQNPGRFIKLNEQDYLALSDNFRRQLQQLAAYSESSGQHQKFSNLAIPALSGLMEDVGELKADNAWKQQVQRLNELAQFQPKLPSTLQAELRDYQQQGYHWLSQLAHWGVGACLADDMGLGKTIQTLALLLQRAPHGSALVVAPTSVAMNWLAEAARFAPTLKLRWYQQQRGLEDLQPFELVVASYGLLQSDSEAFAQVKWHTLVLDEAQAIKNEQTKRSQAVMALQADFKMIATGTPVENHLGELWNLFRFINPGLLGSKQRFQQRFAGPIENGDVNSRQLLKKLIQPFILRRNKTQVLTELPARTEVPLLVELSKDEQHWYEALRQQAVQQLAMQDGNQQAIQVLAEITKLRRFCCHPQLVLPDTALSGSKLAVFAETLREILENQHKVLVFSQFVDHLAIVKTYLEQQNIRFQYLDGSTAAKERKKRVDAFQSGEGDVFLISLKAGGTGLNLTAADYVIHLDPWWNPAVEDQASDRAHRMGQQRPVTIYRLVTKGTIEEKIIALHQQKRDLADSLLEGGEMAARLNATELLKLLQQSVNDVG
ncbi:MULTISPECIES: DEAD/DEAH box helicase [Rheinheimera]|uniref:DEAD/DEAH box helicase n=1 Tax=Rheinheimera marina TaxID=1774958 RepID=A0ABV9JGY5_9GAMM